jgi:hypothetical protein
MVIRGNIIIIVKSQLYYGITPHIGDLMVSSWGYKPLIDRRTYIGDLVTSVIDHLLFDDPPSGKW